MKWLLTLLASTALAAAAQPLAIDPQTGQYRDLSYEALTEQGLSWEERTRLFGGETIHYHELSDAQRTAKQRELDELLTKIDRQCVAQCETDIRTWLDQQAKILPSTYNGPDALTIRAGAILFFRAYETFGDRKYPRRGTRSCRPHLEGPMATRTLALAREDGELHPHSGRLLYRTFLDHALCTQSQWPREILRICPTLRRMFSSRCNDPAVAGAISGPLTVRSLATPASTTASHSTTVPPTHPLEHHGHDVQHHQRREIHRQPPQAVALDRQSQPRRTRPPSSAGATNTMTTPTPARARRYEIELPSTYALTPRHRPHF